ncbi:Nn.00g028510.m01.CDS01 [Neocucurbitaria sp. VM-36]
MASATGKEKRGHMPKVKRVSKPSVSKSKTHTKSTRRKLANDPRSPGPSTRVGASKNIPIIIPDSDEDDADRESVYSPSSLTTSSTRLRSDLSRFRHIPNDSSLTSPRGIYSPFNDSTFQTSFLLRRTTPPPYLEPSIEGSREQHQRNKPVVSKRKARAKTTRHRGTQVQVKTSVPNYKPNNSQNASEEQGGSQRAHYPSPSVTVGANDTERESSIFIGHVPPTTLQDARTSKTFCRVKEKTPGPYKYRSRKSSFQGTSLSTNSATTLKVHSLPPSSEVHTNAEDDDNIELRLADISDFDLRRKVAQLMAVAPAVPVRDLYHLLIDSKGLFPFAKGRAIRAIKPAASTSPTPAVTSPMRDMDTEEIMVKIDPNDPAFEWDADAPELELVDGQKQPKQKLSKASVQNEKARHATRSSKPSIETLYNFAANKSNGASTPSTRRRENSINRDFLLSDDLASIDPDASYFDSSSEHGETNSSDSDVEMKYLEDEVDLDIDMHSEYAFNVNVLVNAPTSPF